MLRARVSRIRYVILVIQHRLRDACRQEHLGRALAIWAGHDRDARHFKHVSALGGIVLRAGEIWVKQLARHRVHAHCGQVAACQGQVQGRRCTQLNHKVDEPGRQGIRVEPRAVEPEVRCRAPVGGDAARLDQPAKRRGWDHLRARAGRQAPAAAVVLAPCQHALRCLSGPVGILVAIQHELR